MGGRGWFRGWPCGAPTHSGGGLVAFVLVTFGQNGRGVVGPEFPAVGCAAEQVGGDHQLADERTQLLVALGGGAAAEDVLGAGHQGGVGADGDVHIGEEELDVVRVDEEYQKAYVVGSPA